jgi:predicted peroxiredoxin
MKIFFLLVAFVALVSSCGQSSKDNKEASGQVVQTTNETKPKDGLFIHITESYNDPHRVLMPMKMAVMMAEDKDVLVYLDIDAVELLVKGAKDLQYKGFETFQIYLKQLLDKKVGVYACPTCLKVSYF